MRIRWLPLLLLVAACAAQADEGNAPSDAQASPSALCGTHADGIFDALDESAYEKAAAYFDAALRERYPAAKLKTDYESLPATYGKLMGRGRPHVGDINGHAVVMAPLIFERGTLTVEVRCGGDGGVSDFHLLPTQAMGKP